MEPSDKVAKNVSNWRVGYQLFSGVLFLILGVVIFLRAKGFMNFWSAGLFGTVLGAYGVYRIIVFIKFFKKKVENR